MSSNALPSTGLPANWQNEISSNKEKSLDTLQNEYTESERQRKYQEASTKQRLDDSANKLKADLQEKQYQRDAAKATKEIEAQEKKDARSRQAQEDIRSNAERVKAQQETKKFKSDINENTRKREAFEKAQADAEAELRKKNKTSAERIAIRNQIEKRREKRRLEEKKRIEYQNKGIPMPQQPSMQKLTPGRIKDAIASKASGVVIGMAGGAADSLSRSHTLQQGKREFAQGTKEFSTAFRSKKVGGNDPYSRVIGISGTVQNAYRTDGHGRSGKRADLEWRREHRNYQSPERQAAASINQNWVSAVTGTAAPIVRHRKTPGKRGGGGGGSQLDNFSRSLF